MRERAHSHHRSMQLSSSVAFHPARSAFDAVFPFRCAFSANNRTVGNERGHAAPRTIPPQAFNMSSYLGVAANLITSSSDLLSTPKSTVSSAQARKMPTSYRCESTDRGEDSYRTITEVPS